MAVPGRKTGAPARNHINLVLTDEQVAALDECCQKLRWTRTDVIREGIARVLVDVRDKK